MNEKDYVLVIDGTSYLMNDEYDENYKFHYNLGFVIPKNNLEQFNNAILKLNLSLSNRLNHNLSVTPLFDILINSEDYSTILEYANMLFKIGIENDVKLFRSNDHKMFLETTGEMTPKLQDLINSTNIVSLYHKSCECLSKKLNLEDAEAELILCDEQLKNYAENELAEVAKIKYFNSQEVALTEFTTAIDIFANLTLKSSNRKNYDEENYSDFDKSMLDLWKNKLFKLFYDKFEKVRDAANQIAEFIIQMKNSPNNFDEIDD